MIFGGVIGEGHVVKLHKEKLKMDAINLELN